MESKPRALRPLFLKPLDPGALPYLLPLLDYTRTDDNDAKVSAVRRGAAALLGEGLERAKGQRSMDWQKWQASRTRAIELLELQREKIESTCPPKEWAQARSKILGDYDLTQIGYE